MKCYLINRQFVRLCTTNLNFPLFLHFLFTISQHIVDSFWNSFKHSIHGYILFTKNASQLGIILKRCLFIFQNFWPPSLPPVSSFKPWKSPQFAIFHTPLPPPQRRRLLWMVPKVMRLWSVMLVRTDMGKNRQMWSLK